MCIVCAFFPPLGLRSKGNSQKIKCTFVNNADTKVALCCIDEKGKLHMVCKLKEGKKEVIETFEGDVFLALGKKKKKRGHTLVINNNIVYAVTAEDEGDNRVKAEIMRGPGKCLLEVGRECQECGVVTVVVVTVVMVTVVMVAVVIVVVVTVVAVAVIVVAVVAVAVVAVVVVAVVVVWCGDSGCGDSGCGDSVCGDNGCGDSGCGVVTVVVVW